ncbi:glycoside-pentoside-hexuronide (GPH):cation symporter [Symbiopectobacterium sp.]|uniref:glycoside-pentoside-hexuronide (GPH):cation symporter n=1 Tax=Symbiopectobacterium sp. TaxID=2952789 RepID=UPI003F3E5AA2
MNNTDPLTLKLSLKEKFSYGIGDFGSNLMLCIGTLYLLKFYTDQLGMPAFYGGIIFLVAKFFTAFTDMLTGVLLDTRRNIGKKGKFRPFILYASVPVALVATAQFVANDFSLTVKTALATVLCIANLCTLAAFNIKLAIQVYYTQYVLNDIHLLSWMGFFSMGCILIGVFMVPGAVKRFGKKQVYLGGLALWAIGDVLNFFWGSNSILFVSFSCMAFFGTAFVNSLNWALVPDTVDHGEWKTGIRAEGSVYTGYTFSRKISAALAGFLPGIMLTHIGYMPNVVQSDATLRGLRQLIFLWPCGLAIVAALTMGFFYQLNEKRFALIIEEIGQRKHQGEKPNEKNNNAFTALKSGG